MKITKNKIIFFIAIIGVLTFAFLYGGNYAAKDKDTGKNEAEITKETQSTTYSETKAEKETTKAEKETENEKSSLNTQDKSEKKIKETSKKTEDKKETTNATEPSTDKYKTDPVPQGKPKPVEPQDVKVGKTEYSCTISIKCGTILDNIDYFDKEKKEILPQDGVILKQITAVFYEGESVFNVLQRECKKNKIHMEFVNTPIYNSAYIEGIANIYEFDCGELSGWMYRVNGWFPNYGCSRYMLKDGDNVEWIYTCDSGKDIGGNNAVGG